MKFRGLVFANLLRKKTRLALTVGSFAIALFLFSILVTVRVGLAGNGELAGADRLVVMNRVSVTRHLPLSYRDRMLGIPGIRCVTHDTWFGGVYQDERNFFPQYAIDPENYREVFPEFSIPEDQWKTFVMDRQGAIVGARTAKRFGWKVGDRVPLKGTIFYGPWEFNVDGIYHGTREGDDETQFWFQFAALDEWRKTNLPGGQRSQVDWYTVRVYSPGDAARIMSAIDETFRNSPFETRTDTESSFLANWFKQMGDIESLLFAIGVVVLLTLLLVTGNTMAMAVRERVGELAVLKAIGFTGRFVLFLIFAESLVVALFGAGIGLVLARTAVHAMRGPLGSFLPTLYLPTGAFLTGMGIAILVGVAAAAAPAVSAMRMSVVESIRKV